VSPGGFVHIMCREWASFLRHPPSALVTNLGGAAPPGGSTCLLDNKAEGIRLNDVCERGLR